MSSKTDKKKTERSPYKVKEVEEAKINAVIDTALIYGATLSEAHLYCKMQGVDVCTKTLQRLVEEKHEMTFTEYKEYMMGYARLRVRQTIIQGAIDGNVPLAIFAAKNLCGWADKVENKIEEVPTKELIQQAKDLIATYEKENKEVSNEPAGH